MENFNTNSIKGNSPLKTKWVVLGVILVIALGFGFYYLNSSGLKGQIKLDQGKNTCVRLMKLNKDKVKIAECLKNYPELAVKNITQAVQSKPVTVESTSPKYGFDNKPFKIVQLMVAPKPFTPEQSLKMGAAPEISQAMFPEVYYDKSDKEFTASVSYTLPSYNDVNMPPIIALPLGLDLCTAADKCAVVKQLSISLAGFGEVNSGSLSFNRSELAETVEFLGLKSNDNAKFRLWVKEPPSNSAIYTEYTQVFVIKVQK